MDPPHVKHIIYSDKFESSYFWIGHIDRNIIYVDILQYYCLLSAAGVGIRDWGTPTMKLQEFTTDESHVKKGFRHILSFKTNFEKGDDCSEALDIFIEAYNFFKQTPVHGIDSLVNPNELFIMRWLMTTVCRGMYREDNLALPAISGCMESQGRIQQEAPGERSYRRPTARSDHGDNW